MKTSSKAPQRPRHLSPYLKAIAADQSQPIDPRAVELWVTDISRRSRWVIRPLLQFIFSILLYVIWFVKRLPLPQFRAHKALQSLICWFCKTFVRPEANELILRHFYTESNILNFLRDNATLSGDAEARSEPEKAALAPVDLYPRTIDDMQQATFVEHDQELFRLFAATGNATTFRVPDTELNWSNWRDFDIDPSVSKARWTQVIDFETAHVLFMCIFCLLLTAEEYRDAINGFKLDQSIAIRVGDIIGDPSVVELAYNKHPLYLVGPGNLTERFLMHGFFTEYLHAKILTHRAS